MYDTFICYNSDDESYAEEVYEFLRSCGLNPFFSAVSLAKTGRADFGPAIDEALEQATNLVVVTPSAQNIKAGYVQAEWRAFVDEKRSQRKAGNIVTVLFRDVDIPSLPFALRQYQVLEWTDEGKRNLLDFLVSGKKTRDRPAVRSHKKRDRRPAVASDSEEQHLISKTPVVVHTILDVRKGKDLVTRGPGVREATPEEMRLLAESVAGSPDEEAVIELPGSKYSVRREPDVFCIEPPPKRPIVRYVKGKKKKRPQYRKKTR